MKRFVLSHLLVAVLSISAAFASGGNVDGKIKLPETITSNGYYVKYEYDTQNRITKISSFLDDDTPRGTTTLEYSGDMHIHANATIVGLQQTVLYLCR